MTATNYGTFASDAAYVADKGSAATGGDAYYNSTLNLYRGYSGGAWRSFADETSVQTFSNKTFDTVTNFTNTTESTNKDTGAVVIEGGLGVEKNVNVGGNVVVTGDLTINGTTVTINTSTLEVEDSNVTVNSGGTLATADDNDAGLRVDITDGTDCQLMFDSTATSKFKIGQVGSESEVATLGHAQILSSKSFSDNTTIRSASTLKLNDSDNSNFVGIKAPTAVTSDYTLVMPSETGTANQILKTDGSNNLSWENFKRSDDIVNHSISASVSANALTIALKTFTASDATSTNPINVSFRNATATTGTPSLVPITGALSLIISSGSTLGHASGIAKYIYVYLINNAGTAELAASSTLYDEGTILSTTAEGGAGAADSISVIYSTTARSNVACRLIGRLLSTQTTAGTWAANMTEISLPPFKKLMSPTIQRFTSGSGTYTTPSGVTWLRVTCIGGGGGGAGSGTASIGSGATGGSTTFGTSLLTAANGNGGVQSGTGGTGGAPTVNSPAIAVKLFNGGRGAPSTLSTGTAFQPIGSAGGSNPAGGAGQGTYGGNGAQAENATGGGGGGGTGLSNAAGNFSGSGGGAGAYLEAIIPVGLVNSTYSYTVGAGGNGGTAGTNGVTGGNGGTGLIIVEEFYS